MPVTPYHFGPSGLLGYIFRKWIDLPVFVLANVVIDVEVLLVNMINTGRPIHRLSHTFLFGTVVGAAWGLVAYLGLPGLKWLMKVAKIPYQTNGLKIILSGILGVWFHVLIDGIYHYDVKPFWPMRKNPLFNLLSHSQVKWICVICFVILAVLYILSLRTKNRRKTTS
ncbi:MAG: hypothetical protein PHP01_09345 [Phycisphaerae bacterium]|nr:hypothetical protein [Phycisphaerae bacterium]